MLLVATQTWSAHVARSLLHTIHYASSINAVWRTHTQRRSQTALLLLLYIFSRTRSSTVELTHLVVKWSAVRNQSEIETSLNMRGMSPFLFVKLVQQRRTQNHAKPAHRVRRSSGQPFTGTTRSAGVGGFGLALAILVGLAKNSDIGRVGKK